MFTPLRMPLILRYLVVCFMLLTLLSCGREVTEPEFPETVVPAGFTPLHIYADLAGTPAVTLEIELSAADLPQTMHFSVISDRSVASKTLSLPAGEQRKLKISAHDADGLETHAGSLEIAVRAGESFSMDLVLEPKGPAGKSIPVCIGVLIITIDPAVIELKVAETHRLVARIVDVNGGVINERPTWSTSHSGIVSIKTNGEITAEASGFATIVAEFQRTVGLARVFVAGEAAEYFVDASRGDNGNPGTRAEPFATIQKGIDMAAAAGGDVLVAGGSYAESLVLATKVNIHGGHDGATWLRNPDSHPTFVFGGPTAVIGNGVKSLTIDGLHIHSADGVPLPPSAMPNAIRPDFNSVGLQLVDCQDIIASNNQIRAGKGAPGRTMDNLTGARNGSPGVNGMSGGVRTTIPVGAAGGTGGDGSSNGGAGGDAQDAVYYYTHELVRELIQSDWDQPEAGVAGSPAGLGGLAGNAGTGYDNAFWSIAGGLWDDIKDWFCGFFGGCADDSVDPLADWGGAGQDGTPGAKGAPGTNGFGGMAFGGIRAGTYVAAAGANGSNGSAGGGGGAAGVYGYGGEGGGGSFGIMLMNSTEVQLRANSIATNGGGRGGDGGAGGAGGFGGGGGSGGNGGDSADMDLGIGVGVEISLDLPDAAILFGGVGGDGGNGGDGGEGGGGGGGGGGPSVGIVEDMATRSTRSANNFELGDGGDGGESRGNGTSTEGNVGATGLRAEFAKLAQPGAVEMFQELMLPSGELWPASFRAMACAEAEATR